MQKADCLVVGQGLAGTLLTHFLLTNGFSVALFNEPAHITSSRIAAGIVHPITGRRLVKSWMAETFIPFAEETYSLCESLTGCSFYHRKTILELVKEVKEYNDWIACSQDSETSGYVSIPRELPHKEKLFPFLQGVNVQGAYLDLPDFLHGMQTFFEKKCLCYLESFSHDSLMLENDRIVYKDLEASRIIFCEGYKGSMNPFWKSLPWQLSKGEILLVRCAGLDAAEIINRKIFILPLDDDLYKVGSTYSWDSLNEVPTMEAREKLIREMQKILRLPFEVIAHYAAVRPTVRERRPFLGFHPQHPRVGIFNGLGTKGVMSGPWLAHHLTSHIKNNNALLADTDVHRFADSFLKPAV